jgi:hypothetical protein
VQTVPPRCRKPRDEEREGAIEIEIPNLTDKDAPVAIKERELLASGETVERKYRLFNGKLWHTKKFCESGLREDELEPIKETVECMQLSHLDKEQHLERINQWAASTILVEGVPHCPLPGEPRVFVEYDWSREKECSVSIERCFGYYQTNRRKCEYYSANEFDNAKAEQKRLEKIQEDWLKSQGHQNEEKIITKNRFSLEVLISSAVELSPQADHEAEMEERFKNRLKKF